MGLGWPLPRGAIYSEVFILLLLCSLQFIHIENFRSPGEETTKMIILFLLEVVLKEKQITYVF